MSPFEKFPHDELKTLRDELRQSGMDSFQSAELLAAFLTQHGYGVSNLEARVAAARIERVGFALPHMQEELEKIAWVM
jgi:DNA repair protein RadC